MRLPEVPPRKAKHTEEQLKLAANGLQALALTLFAAVVVAPSFNPQLAAANWVTVVFALSASAAETLAFFLLRYVPVKDDP